MKGKYFMEHVQLSYCVNKSGSQYVTKDTTANARQLRVNCAVSYAITHEFISNIGITGLEKGRSTVATSKQSFSTSWYEHFRLYENCILF